MISVRIVNGIIQLLKIKAYINNNPIIFTGLSEEQVKKLNYEDIVAFTVAEGGAMGNPGNIEIVVSKK